MTDADADLFEMRYSPKRVRFWLQHWEDLLTLTQSPRSASAIAERLKREWLRLQDQRIDCLCSEFDHDPQFAISASAGGYRARSTSASDIKADLERATDALPIYWNATRAIYRAMGREDIWKQRSTWFVGERSRPGDRAPEPRGSAYQCANIMARVLGWQDVTLTNRVSSA